MQPRSSSAMTHDRAVCTVQVVTDKINNFRRKLVSGMMNPKFLFIIATFSFILLKQLDSTIKRIIHIFLLSIAM